MNRQRFLIYVFVPLVFLSGCSGGTIKGGEGQGLGPNILLGERLETNQSDALLVAQQRCAREKPGSVAAITNVEDPGILYMVRYTYSCLPSAKEPLEVKKQESGQLRAEAEAAKQRQKELEEQLRQARQQPVAPVQAATPTSTDRLSLDASKKKCVDLGFKPATEAFGKCVLQLSK